MADKTEQLNDRARLYFQFGALLFREVDANWLQAFLVDIRPQWAELGCSFDADMDVAPQRLKEDLDTEFTTLWYAPGGIPVYESIFETGMVFQEPSDKVQEIYLKENFEFNIDEEKSFPDHAGVELEFLGRLLSRQSEALSRDDEDEAARIQGVFVDFLHKHAGRWIPAMLHYSIQAAQHSFYRELCKMTLGFLLSEMEEELPRRVRENLMALLDREPKKMDYDADFRKASGL